MNHSLKMILAGLVMCIMTQGIMLFIDHYVLIHLGDWTMAISDKFLVFKWTTIDKNLVRWFPLFVGIVCALTRVQKLEVLVKRVIWTLTSVIIALLTAVIIALFTWTKTGADSFLLPDYLKYQPFDHFWTVFILIGILLPLIPTIINAKSNDSVHETIDK